MSRLLSLPNALALAALLAAAAPNALRASQLVLANGDRLTGHVFKPEDGKIYFHSDNLGDIGAPEDGVTIVEPPPASPPSESLAGLPPQPAKPAHAATPVAVIPSAHAGWWDWWPSLPWITRPFMVLRPVVTRWSGKIEFGYGNELTTARTVTTTLRTDAERK